MAAKGQGAAPAALTPTIQGGPRRPLGPGSAAERGAPGRRHRPGSGRAGEEANGLRTGRVGTLAGLDRGSLSRRCGWPRFLGATFRSVISFRGGEDGSSFQLPEVGCQLAAPGAGVRVGRARRLGLRSGKKAQRRPAAFCFPLNIERRPGAPGPSAASDQRLQSLGAPPCVSAGLRAGPVPGAAFLRVIPPRFMITSCVCFFNDTGISCPRHFYFVEFVLLSQNLVLVGGIASK